MKCPICRFGETQPGLSTTTYTEGETIIVIRGVPAEICDSCGEDYTDEQTTTRILELLHEPCQDGVQVSVRDYTSA